MTPEKTMQHLEAWLAKKEAEYKEATTSWGAGYQRAIEDMQLEIERLNKGEKTAEPYEFTKR